MPSLSRRIVAGTIAGVVGTVAMDLLWYDRYRRGGGDDGFSDWEFATGTSSFDEASAPGQVGKKIADTVGVEVPDEAAGPTTNVMHWLTGVGYGLAHALFQNGRGPVGGGIGTGVGAFGNSYATMGALGIYDPIWTYDRDALGKDLSAHLVFGAATGIAYRLFAGSTAA